MEKYKWLITGAAGFIGSHLTEYLLSNGHSVIGLDNFSTGKRENIENFLTGDPSKKSEKFHLIEGDIRDLPTCEEACEGVDFVLHHAALASVPLSMKNPMLTHEVNVTGFLNMLEAARKHKIKRFVYASSSAVYGDDPHLPKTELRTGVPLSPYAATKSINEIYAGMYTQVFGLECVGLRYFNVFGPRQDPNGAYAAVIPRWFDALAKNEQVVIYGDGENTRDFCYIDDVVRANICAATAASKRAPGGVFNIGMGKQTSLNELFEVMKKIEKKAVPELETATHSEDDVIEQKQASNARPYEGQSAAPRYEAFREGDIRHSVADASLAASVLNFKAQYSLKQGLEKIFDFNRISE